MFGNQPISFTDYITYSCSLFVPFWPFLDTLDFQTARPTKDELSGAVQKEKWTNFKF